MTSTPNVITTMAQNTAVIHLVIPGRDMPKYMDPAITEILKELADQGVAPAGRSVLDPHRCAVPRRDLRLHLRDRLDRFQQ